MTISMLAQGSKAYWTFTTKDGSTYTSDANGVINGITDGDVVDLVNMGCSFLAVAPTGKNNLAATTAPTTTDDSADDYAIGSLWLDTTNDIAYQCIDATEGAAVWIQYPNSSAANTWDALQTFAAGIAFGGATTVNVVTMPDNLADALNFIQGSNSYLKFVTTDSAETIVAGVNLTLADAKNIILDTTTGTKIGTATNQKLGFFNKTPVTQQATAGTTTGFTAGGGTTATSASTFTGNTGSAAYTVGDIVLALKNLGLMAA